MAILILLSADYCKEDKVVDRLTSQTNYRLATTNQIISEAAALSQMDEEKIKRAFTLKTSVFENFTHEKQFALAYIKLTLAKMLLVSVGRDLILTGYPGQLVPNEITHFFRVGLIANKQFRINTFLKKEDGTARDAEKAINHLDEKRAEWLKRYCNINNPFDSSLHDLIIPMNKESVVDASNLIIKYLDKDILQPTPSSAQAVDDFYLQAMVEVALAQKGHNVTIRADKGKIYITINKKVIRLSRLKEELKDIVEKVNGVEEVDISLGEDFYQADVYRKFNMELPSKVLLVDDEQEFVQTLSERLILRDMGTAVVHDGTSALNLVGEDKPQVMVLDLKMPGVDGLKVLKRVKETSPSVEVIILTGHGSEEDRKKCMELGAFSYLRKPVDIAKLTAVIKEAHEKATS